MNAEREAALKIAVQELGKSVAIGFVPYLGQAIDVYDTLESIWHLNASKNQDDKDEAKFQLVMALIGWIPGPGDGLKKSLRLVNKDPQRFAPILFDLLRHVLEICDVKTSPEALLDEVFNAGKLKGQIGSIRRGIEASSAFEALPQSGQNIAKSVLRTAEAELPSWVGLVSKKLLRWKKMQPNSSARVQTGGRARQGVPDPKDSSVSSQGQSRAGHGQPGTPLSSVVATTAVNLVNEQLGVLGEHIADYYCAEKLGWGASWDKHDLGEQGQWKGDNPSQSVVGKLSNNHKLFKLSDGANGTGIDAVWRANSKNAGKPYAVVEAKSDLKIDEPRFIKKPPGTRKPSVVSKLGVNGIPKAEDLLEPEIPDANASTTPAPAGGGRAGRTGAARSNASSPHTTTSAGSAPARIIVQMSHEWIRQNMARAVGVSLARDVLRLTAPNNHAYSRHLIYTPMWLPSAIKHAQAVMSGTANNGATHSDHDVIQNLHYEEAEVKSAVNAKKAKLRKKYGNQSSLVSEQ